MSPREQNKALVEEMRGEPNRAPILSRIRSELSGKPMPDDANWPEIRVNNRELRDITSETHDALVAANRPPEIFVRSAELVRVVQDEHARSLIRPIDKHVLRNRCTRIADFLRENIDGESKHVSPPMDVMNDLMALGEWPKLPALVGVIETPTIRPNGSVFSLPGYDPTTKLVYAPAEDFSLPTIPAQPTPAMLKAAIRTLAEPFADFPFVDDSSLANTIGAVVTAIASPAIEGRIPLTVVTGTCPGTGKTLLVEGIAMMATGRQPMVMTAPEDETEWSKSITAALVEGRRLIAIDNVSETLRSSNLAACLSAGEWSARLLGGNDKTLSVPNRSMFVATGNNLQLGGDLPRRCYWIRLDAKTSRPWRGREFRHPDLIEHVKRNRAELVTAALILCRGWFAAKQPAAPTPTIGGFESWSRTIGGILHFAGVNGFLGNLDDLYNSNDEESTEWETFLAAWHGRFQNGAITIGTLADDLKENRPLAESLPDDLALAFGADVAKFKIRAGKALKARVGRRYGEAGYHLHRGADTHAKVAEWTVKTAGDAGNCGSVTTPHETISGDIHVGPVGNTPATPSTPRDVETRELLAMGAA